MKKLILLAVVVFGFAATSFAQTLTASAAAFALIETPAVPGPQLGWVQDLQFGSINSSLLISGTSTVGVASSNTSSATYGANLSLGVQAATIQAAKFQITNPGAGVYVVATPSPFTITGPGTAMTVTPAVASGLTLAAGVKTFYIGGVLTVNANQAAGNYVNYGGLAVTVSY